MQKNNNSDTEKNPIERSAKEIKMFILYGADKKRPFTHSNHKQGDMFRIERPKEMKRKEESSKAHIKKQEERNRFLQVLQEPQRANRFLRAFSCTLALFSKYESSIFIRYSW